MNKINNLLNKNKELKLELELLTNLIKPQATKIAELMSNEYKRLRLIYCPKFADHKGDWCHDYSGITLTIEENNRLTLNYLTPSFAEIIEPNKSIIIDDSIFTDEGINLIIKNISSEFENKLIKSKKDDEDYKKSRIQYLKNQIEELEKC